MVVQQEAVEFPMQRRVLKMMVKFPTNEKRKSSVQSVMHREDTRLSRGDSANASGWAAQRKEQDQEDTSLVHRANA